MNIIQKIETAIIVLIGKIIWAPKDLLSIPEKEQLNTLLIPNYYIILTRNNNHLSTYFISLGDFLLKGKFGYWGHALINMENTVIDNTDFRFVEAIGTGVQYATFDEVMAVNSVALLKPKNMPIDAWTLILDKAKTDIGKPYDTLFDLQQDQKLSCVELVRNALMADPNYSTNFANFEAMVQQYDRITPQMFYDNPDFEVVYEIRR